MLSLADVLLVSSVSSLPVEVLPIICSSLMGVDQDDHLHHSLGGHQVVNQPLQLVIVHYEVHLPLSLVGEPVLHPCDRALQVLLSPAQHVKSCVSSLAITSFNMSVVLFTRSC